MSRIAFRADFFDASALVKVFTDEPNSDVIRNYWHARATKYTTPFCFYEALNILKGKWSYHKKLELPEYLEAAYELTLWYGASSSKITDLDFTDPLTFAKTRYLAERYSLDLSDAFQIMSVRHGFFSVLVNDSKTVFVTADNNLANAAEKEGLCTWNVNSSLSPPA